MAITDAQQAKQILMKKGGPVHRHQLAKKRHNKLINHEINKSNNLEVSLLHDCDNQNL